MSTNCLNKKVKINVATQAKVDKFIDLSTSNMSRDEILAEMGISDLQYRRYAALARAQMADPDRRTAYAMKLSNLLTKRLIEVRHDYETCEDPRAKANFSRVINDTIKLFSDQFSKLGILPNETKQLHVTTLNLTPADIEKEIARLNEDN